MMEWTFRGAAIGKWIPAMMLLIGSGIDLRYKVVPMLLPACMALIGTGYRLVSGEFMEWDTFLCLIPGILLMLWAKQSRGGLGTGDAWMILALGTMLDFTHLVGTVFCAFWMAGLLALFVFIFRRKKEMELPLLPFIFIGYAMSLAAGEI